MDSTTKLRCSEETDFVVLYYDQSDIEEIEENEESLSHSLEDTLTNNLIQPEDDNTPSSSNQRDKSDSDEDDVTNEIDSEQEEVSQQLERRQQIHGSQAEELSSEDDIEPVGTSLDIVNQETYDSRISNDDDVNNDNNEESDSEVDDDMEEIPVVYFIQEDENGVELEEEIMDLRTIKRPRVYRHTPNSLINVRLNLMLCFAITAGISMGLGNYLGWSANWENTKTNVTLDDDHFIELKNLKNKLSDCMNSQSKGARQSSCEDMKICHQNSDYRKEKFDTLYSSYETELKWAQKKKEKKPKLDKEIKKRKKKKEKKKERKSEKSRVEREIYRARSEERLKGERSYR